MRGSAECIALATPDCQKLTDNVVDHLSQESLLCRLSDLTLDLIFGAFATSSFLTARCWWICSIRRDRSRSISIKRKPRTGARSVVLYLARRRWLIVVTGLADGEKSSMSSTCSSRIIGASF